MTIPKLGIFFIVVAFLLTIPAFTRLSKTTEETMYEGLRDSVVSDASEYIEAKAAKARKAFKEYNSINNAEALVTTEDRSRASDVAHQLEREYRDKCDEFATKRHIK